LLSYGLLLAQMSPSGCFPLFPPDAKKIRRQLGAADAKSVDVGVFS